MSVSEPPILLQSSSHSVENDHVAIWGPGGAEVEKTRFPAGGGAGREPSSDVHPRRRTAPRLISEIVLISGVR